MTDSAATGEKKSHGYLGLLVLVAAIVLGCLFGYVYGERMWLASGGPQILLEKRIKTLEQKERRIEAAQEQDNPDRVARLRGHLPIIQADIRDLEAKVDHVQNNPGEYRVAAICWELVDFAGDLFLQVLTLLVIPLVITSMICGITSLGDIRKVGRLGGYTIGYYTITTGIAVVIGMAIVLLIRPGESPDDTFAYVSENVEAKEDTTILETLLNVVRGDEDDAGSGMFPKNLFEAATQTNVLALIVFSMVFAGALTTIGAKGRSAIEFFEGANEAVMKMVHLVMLFAPIGIFGLVASNIAKNGGAEAFSTELMRISWYVASVILGLGLHSLALLSILALITRRNPLRYVLGVMRALLTAMSTASSSATLPLTMECVEENNGVSKRSASFVLPLGATINMDGTALYEAVAVIFIAQSFDVELNAAQLVVIFLTSTLAAIGAAGIPEAGLVTMVIVVQAANLPMEGIGTILAVDWFLDRLRTTVNVLGDSIGAGVIDRLVLHNSAKR
jgi:Na+/H+-dicarboxylate symporter